ncbi:uncharacterized protein LOC119651910 [Hermetia illucens]|uniref:uncharacterized protein LOC119651910 n=1 Tax=Hermetia illucens TaxID=343691 RepID=UPI0018CC3481|nr:uncharacterized protein LOC119651910 [Hermetia illucens]
MASPSQVEPRQYIEILDEEFSQYLEVAQSIAKTMKRPKDKKICIKYIRKCMELDAPNIEVKAHRNEFFRYFLRMLQSTAASQPPQYDAWFKPSAKPKESSRISSFWSHDKRTYIAAKQIPGCGTLIYLATSYDPRLGWQKFGFSSPN